MHANPQHTRYLANHFYPYYTTPYHREAPPIILHSPSIYRTPLPPSTLPLTLLLQTIPHTLPHPLLELSRIIPPQRRSLDIRRRLVVGARQHGDDGEQDGFGGLHGRPALGGGFVAVLVFFGRVQDRDAYVAVCVDCWARLV